MPAAVQGECDRRVCLNLSDSQHLQQLTVGTRQTTEPETVQESPKSYCHWLTHFKIEGPEEVPIRVSILSSSLIVPYAILMSICQAMGLSQENRVYVSWISMAIVNTLRCPLTVILAFKSSKKPVKKDKIKDDIIHREHPEDAPKELHDSNTFTL